MLGPTNERHSTFSRREQYVPDFQMAMQMSRDHLRMGPALPSPSLLLFGPQMLMQNINRALLGSGADFALWKINLTATILQISFTSCHTDLSNPPRSLFPASLQSIWLT